MAENNETQTAAPSRVETEVAKPQVSSVSFGKEGPEAKTTDEQSNSLEIGEDLDLEGGEEGSEEGTGEDTEGAEGDGSEEGSEGEGSDLPDYDPESEEVRAQYDERYFKDGELNREALSTEYWKSFEANGGDLTKSGLSEGTYAYLKDTLGVSKETVKEIEAGLVAKHSNTEQQFFSKFGGVERYNRAITWAKEGGYSEEQQARFRAAYAKGGDDRDDAVDALMNRFHRATGGGNKDGRRGPPRRNSSPQRDVTGGAGARPQSGGSGDRFKNAGEHRAASEAARREFKEAEAKGDKAAMKAASDKSRAVYQKARRGYVNR